MEQSAWFSSADILSWSQLFVAFVTALATVALWHVTKVLAIETKRMAEGASQPNVVVTLEPSGWSIIHFNISVVNTGNAPAYGITISSEPPLPFKETAEIKDAPLQNISILKPGQEMFSYLCEFSKLKDKRFKITTTWKRQPLSKTLESLTYEIDMADFSGVRHLGASDPLIEIAKQIKTYREDWRNIASGFNRMKIDVFTSTDRVKEERRIRRKLQQLMKEDSEQNDEI